MKDLCDRVVFIYGAQNEVIFTMMSSEKSKSLDHKLATMFQLQLNPYLYCERLIS